MIKLVFFLMLATAVGHAEITTDVEIAPGGTVTGTGTGYELIWQQLPGTVTGHGLSSQFFTDFDQTSEIADDVRLNNQSWIIDEARWWGTYWNPGGTAYDPEFTIYIYPDEGEIPAQPYTGGHLVEYTVPSGTTGETYDPGLDRYIYWTGIIDWYLIQNIKYWFVYQAHLDFGICGQWGIASTDEGDIWEHDVYFTGDAFGYTTWQDGVTIFGYEVDIAHEFYVYT